MHNFIEDLAESALNVACLEIQNKIWINDGGYASMFFSDDSVRNKFKEYIMDEIDNKIEELENWFDNNPQTQPY